MRKPWPPFGRSKAPSPPPKVISLFRLKTCFRMTTGVFLSGRRKRNGTLQVPLLGQPPIRNGEAKPDFPQWSAFSQLLCFASNMFSAEPRRGPVGSAEEKRHLANAAPWATANSKWRGETRLSTMERIFPITLLRLKHVFDASTAQPLVQSQLKLGIA